MAPKPLDSGEEELRRTTRVCELEFQLRLLRVRGWTSTRRGRLTKLQRGTETTTMPPALQSEEETVIAQLGHRRRISLALGIGLSLVPAR